MKTLQSLRPMRALLVLGIAALAPCLCAQLTIPGADGSDGALNVTVSTNIDLSRAVTGLWDGNNAANAGRGIYDLSKWAVVFKYSLVNIAPGATVTFSNHPSRAPVVWLVNGNVTVGGTVNLDGAGSVAGGLLAEGGPGGFRGGGGNAGELPPGAGLGPGGGASGSGGGYNTLDTRGYGTIELLPLIGGSGGGGLASTYSSAGGGGAIFIACAGTNTISGAIQANGGGAGPSLATGGSGGAIRLLADQIRGTGSIRTIGGNVAAGSSASTVGRVRLQANAVSGGLSVQPSATSESPTPVVLWPTSNAPMVRVVSVAGQPAPADPRAALDNIPADIGFATSSSSTILLETQNFPTNATVKVFVKPRYGNQSVYQATWINGTANLALWQVQHAFIPGYAVIQARAVAQ